VKSLSSAIKSQILIEVNRIQMPSPVFSVLAMPNRVLLPRWALNFWRAYREYFSHKTVSRGDIELNLTSDIKIKALLNLIDCPDTHQQIALFWNE
jgi:hypothetical protein